MSSPCTATRISISGVLHCVLQRTFFLEREELIQVLNEDQAIARFEQALDVLATASDVASARHIVARPLHHAQYRLRDDGETPLARVRHHQAVGYFHAPMGETETLADAHDRDHLALYI